MKPPYAPFPVRLACAREMVATMRPLGVAQLDQLEAAASQVDAILAAATVGLTALMPGRFSATGHHVDADQKARLLAAILGCRPCCHLGPGTGAQPRMADLNHHRLVCLRCAQTVYRRIDDDRCELCDEPTAGRFSEVLCSLGNTLISGNVGDCCLWVATGERAA